MTNYIFLKPKRVILFLHSFLFALCLAAQGPVQITKSVTQPSCNGGSTGAISVVASGGTAPYTYEWRVGMGGAIFSNNPSISGLALDLYTIKVTDSNNNYSIDSVRITSEIKGFVNTLASADCPLTNGSAEVSILGGTAPFTYSWSNGATSSVVTNLAGDAILTVQAQDVNGCDVYFYDNSNPPSLTGEVTIGMNSGVNVNYIITPEQHLTNNGSITLNPTGGTPPYTYHWNTTPVSNGIILSNLSSGSYSVMVTDANNCYTNASIFVNRDLDSIQVHVSKTNDHCSKSIGVASLTITGGVSPYSVHWSDGSSALSRSDLGYGYHSVDVTDVNGDVSHNLIFIDDISPVNTFVTTTETDCSNNGGSVIVNVSGGASPYTYQWNNGATTAALNNLSRNYYSVLVTDANGCKAVSSAFVNIDTSCYANISGIVFQDNNGNCIQDAGDFPIMNSSVYINAALNLGFLYDSYSYTGISGQYVSYYILPAQYTVDNQDDVRTAACPVSGVHSINISTSGVNYPNKDFAMVPASLFEDVALIYGSNLSEPRPGFNYSYNFSYKNNGTMPSDGYIEVVYGNSETFVSSLPAPNFHDPATRKLRFNYNSLMLGEIRSIQLMLNLPSTTLLGSTYSHSITADINDVDPTPSNNLLTRHFTVVGSFDPNDLKVFPEGNITEEDSVLNYAIRFQNTGTYPAELVIVRDTLESNLDISTISNITASHNFKFKVLENRVIEFAFENIYLPDSTRNERGSHGFVNFSIKRNKNLNPGTQIKNQAEIYFDFNLPVVTNTTVNTIALSTGVKYKAPALGGKVYPNPAKDFAEFRFEKEISSVQFMNASGIPVINQEINGKKEFRLELTLSQGMYFYNAVDIDGNSCTGKLIIE